MSLQRDFPPVYKTPGVDMHLQILQTVTLFSVRRVGKTSKTAIFSISKRLVQSFNFSYRKTIRKWYGKTEINNLGRLTLLTLTAKCIKKKANLSRLFVANQLCNGFSGVFVKPFNRHRRYSKKYLIVFYDLSKRRQRRLKEIAAAGCQSLVRSCTCGDSCVFHNKHESDSSFCNGSN